MTTNKVEIGVCNIPNRSIFEGDNLDVMRGINDACVDLIYLDPPFNSNRDYAAPIGSKAAGAAFKDTWDEGDVVLDPFCGVLRLASRRSGWTGSGSVSICRRWR